MIDVYYPYKEGLSVWDELRYSLRSLDQHLKIPFRVVIVGDCPAWVKNVYHIPVAPIVSGAECCLKDTINKLKVYINHQNAADQFIRMYDDTYLIADADYTHFNKARAMYQFKELPPRNGVWWEQLRRTSKALANVGYNTETHFPEWYNRSKMQEIFEFFDVENNLLLVSTLYNNTFFDSKDILPQCKLTGDGAKFYGSAAVNNFNYAPEDNVERACAKKLFLNHNDIGLTDQLKAYLIKKFPNKSMYEK